MVVVGSTGSPSALICSLRRSWKGAGLEKDSAVRPLMRSDDAVSTVRLAANPAQALACAGNSWSACSRHVRSFRHDGTSFENKEHDSFSQQNNYKTIDQQHHNRYYADVT